jgi:hypothetical protein
MTARFTNADVGRMMVYRGSRYRNGSDVEGALVSWDDKYVYLTTDVRRAPGGFHHEDVFFKGPPIARKERGVEAQ